MSCILWVHNLNSPADNKDQVALGSSKLVRISSFLSTRGTFACPRIMPHMAFQESSRARTLAGKGETAVGIHKKLVRSRLLKAGKSPNSKKTLGPDLTSVRRLLKGKTFVAGKPESRGRKKTLTKANCARLNKVRKELIKKADKQKEVVWEEVIKKARVPKVTATTASKSMSDAGYDVKWRKPREKPLRDKAAEKEREVVCKAWQKKPASWWADDLDLIQDNKHFEIPTTARGRLYGKSKRVRGHLRTRAEGIKKEFTKPSSSKKQRVNPGCTVNVYAAISNCKVVAWEYLGKKWCAKAAADVYEKVTIKVLRRHRGEKSKYKILEDNDGTGYKSKLAKATKEKLKIEPIRFPRYSPDLNPLDFSIWNEVLRRMNEQKAPANEGKTAYMKRLRLTALRLPKDYIRKTVLSIKSRAKAVADNLGGDIPRD